MLHYTVHARYKLQLRKAASAIILSLTLTYIYNTVMPATADGCLLACTAAVRVAQHCSVNTCRSTQLKQ
jgi:hypothetical protein